MGCRPSSQPGSSGRPLPSHSPGWPVGRQNDWREMAIRKRTPIIDRLMANVRRVPSGCLEWQGATRGNMGYPALINEPGASPRVTYGHVVSFEYHHGPLATGEVVRHTCDNPICVNPDHLIRGSLSDNRLDTVRRGRDGDHGRKLTETDVLAMRDGFALGRTIAEMAMHFGISELQASRVKSGASWNKVQRGDSGR